MTEEDRRKIYSEDFADLVYEYSYHSTILVDIVNETHNYIDDKYAVLYFPAKLVTQKISTEYGYSVIPKVFGLVDVTNLEDIGVSNLQNTLALKGNGVLLGFIDTGIDYTNPIFQHSNKNTRILSIWDQSIYNNQAMEDTFYYGTEYNDEQINLALQNENPFSVVPSTDDIGHGTSLAGLAGGTLNEMENFRGIATQAEFVVVKLKNAKANLKNYWGIPEEAICFQENDIMFGLRYLYNKARNLKRPMVICLGLGTNQGAHDGRTFLSLLLSDIGERNGIVIVVAAGNEGSTGHHYYGIVDAEKGFDTVELNVSEGEKGFTLEIWGQVPGTYSIDMISPTGEYIPRIPARLNESREIRFLFENTIVLIDYLIVEVQSGDQLILVRFRNPAPGIWRFRVYGGGDISSGFHIWLPLRGFIKENTVFLRPNPDTTVTEPGNTQIPITVTAYDHRNQGAYFNASRGYTRDYIIKPELAAPGVNVFAPLLDKKYEEKSGTSIAAAEAAGISALLLEWGIIRGNFSNMDSLEVKKLLIRGVKRNPSLTYPNKEIGFGTLDIYRTFMNLRGE